MLGSFGGGGGGGERWGCNPERMDVCQLTRRNCTIPQWGN